jgi:flagellar motor switch protein FliM
VIPLDKLTTEPVDVYLGQTSAFQASVGKSRKKRAVQIQKMYDEESLLQLLTDRSSSSSTQGSDDE